MYPWVKHPNLPIKRVVFSARKIGIDEYHKITELTKPTLTLIFRSKRVNNNWGYLVDGEHIVHDKYREMKNTGEFDGREEI